MPVYTVISYHFLFIVLQITCFYVVHAKFGDAPYVKYTYIVLPRPQCPSLRPKIIHFSDNFMFLSSQKRVRFFFLFYFRQNSNNLCALPTVGNLEREH